MPVWAISLVVNVLQKTGLIDWAEAFVAKGIIKTEQRLEKLQTFQEYPGGKNGQPSATNQGPT